MSGVVHARALIAAGHVKEVLIVDGPQVFHAAVKAAMMKYQCLHGTDRHVWADQQFGFKLECENDEAQTNCIRPMSLPSRKKSAASQRP